MGWMVRKKTKDQKKAAAKKEKEMKKKAEEMKKKGDAAREKADKQIARKKVEAEAKAKGEEPPPVEEEEEKKEEEKPAEISDVEDEEPDEPEPEDTTPPTVSLTAEDKAIRFFKHNVADISPPALAKSFAKFSAPDADEGFDAIKYLWSKEKEAGAYIKKWIFDKKQTTPVEDIVPSAWFKQKAAHWATESGMWKNKQNDYRNLLSKKAAAKKAKADRKAAAEKKAKMEADRKEKEAEEKEEEKKEEEVEAEAPKEVVEQDSEPEVEID